jgi:hypothetical protein
MSHGLATVQPRSTHTYALGAASTQHGVYTAVDFDASKVSVVFGEVCVDVVWCVLSQITATRNGKIHPELAVVRVPCAAATTFSRTRVCPLSWHRTTSARPSMLTATFS